MSSVFDRRDHPPDDTSLAATLGATKAHWDALLALLATRAKGVAQEWKFYGGKLGWQLKVSEKKRALVYLVPHERSFLAAMALRPDAIAALRAHALPEALVREIETAKESPEGRPARVEVRDAQDADVVRRLLAIKLGDR